jgi:hypothetical protein
LDKAIGDVRTAIAQWDVDSLTRAASRLELGRDARSDDAYCRELWRGAALFHAVLALSDREPVASRDLQRSLRDKAIQALNTALAQQPDNSDSHAMLAVLYGQQIRGRPLMAIKLGPLVTRHREVAKRAQHTNPRVNYLEGVSLLKQAHNAEQVAAALESLLVAEKLFNAEAGTSKDYRQPDWGRAHNMMFIGEANQRLERTVQAMTAFQNAMHLMPNLERARRGYESCRQATQDQ